MHNQVALQQTIVTQRVFSAKPAGYLLQGPLALTAKAPTAPFLAPLSFMTNLVDGFFSTCFMIVSTKVQGTRLLL